MVPANPTPIQFKNVEIHCPQKDGPCVFSKIGSGSYFKLVGEMERSENTFFEYGAVFESLTHTGYCLTLDSRRVSIFK